MPKKGFLLLLFVLASLSLIAYQTSRKHALILQPLNSVFYAFSAVKNTIEETVSSPFRTLFLREKENRMLKAEVARLEQERQQWQEALLENARLRELLSLKENEERYIASARIVSRGPEQWTNVVVLDKGASDGIRKDMAAVTQKGLAGKIIAVSASHSQLLLPVDIRFSASARFQQSRAEGILSGAGFRECRIKYVTVEEEVSQGDIVLTSGLDELFPQGIPIGYVVSVKKKTYGLFQEVIVRPFVDASKVEAVAILSR
jgi:rod shape-determining protein MreC